MINRTKSFLKRKAKELFTISNEDENVLEGEDVITGDVDCLPHKLDDWGGSNTSQGDALFPPFPATVCPVQWVGQLAGDGFLK